MPFYDEIVMIRDENRPSWTAGCFVVLGSNQNPSIGGQTQSLGDQDQAQRCTKQLSMIPTNKSESKHLRIEGTSRARKTDENRKRHKNPTS
jgi:hypothetical protein